MQTIRSASDGGGVLGIVANHAAMPKYGDTLASSAATAMWSITASTAIASGAVTTTITTTARFGRALASGTPAAVGGSTSSLT